MASHIPPSIDPVAADRWAKSIAVVSPPWLHEEVARRMEERLQWIVRKPGSWLDWEPSRGGYFGHERVRRRYPDALAAVWEPIDHRVNASKSALTPAWWRFASRKRAPIFGLPAAPVDMVWANMALHMAADPQALIGRWYDALADDGYLMFSCLGPDTLAELRRAYAQTAWPAPHHEFTDMHDWGDMLVQAGFAEPVMDMERVTLSYSSADALIAELRTLGRNLSANRFQGLRARNWRHELAERLTAQSARDKDAGRLILTFEVVYGHAFKPRPRLPLSSKTVVSLEEMKSTLKIGRRPSMQSK
jgi:malonyl-CoA O-methyltransferase